MLSERFADVIPAGANYVMKRLKENGYDAFVVGGCVRDYLSGKEPHDWDICTSATPEQVKGIIEAPVYDTGLQHGTVTVSVLGDTYEVTTFRIDGEYKDYRRPDNVVFTGDLIKDLERRDFKMNAMVADRNGVILDPFGGIDDIHNHVVSCVGDPDERFKEDALRILRAIRFAAVMGYSIEEKTAESIRKYVHLLNEISYERISAELVKLVRGRYAYDMMLKFPEVFCEIIPELKRCYGFDQNNKYHQYTVYDHMAHALGNYMGDDVYVKLALFFHDIGKPLCYTEDENGGHFYGHGGLSEAVTRRVMKRLRFDSATIEEVCKLVLYHDGIIEPTPKAVRRWVNRVGEDSFKRLLQIRVADIKAHKAGTQQGRLAKVGQIALVFQELIDKRECFSMKDLAINGNDLIEIGFVQGKELGDVLKSLLDKVLDGELQNDKDVLIAEARYLYEGSKG